MEEIHTTTTVTETVTIKKPGNGAGTTALILGIIGFIFSFIPGINWVFAIVDIVAIILGFIGLGKSKKNGSGKGGAIVGLILGILGVITVLVMSIALLS